MIEIREEVDRRRSKTRRGKFSNTLNFLSKTFFRDPKVVVPLNEFSYEISGNQLVASL